MNNAFFFQTQQISDFSSIFNTFKEQNILFSYFLVDQNYYLFLYAKESIQLDTIYESVELIEELDSKQRKIRSLRGFFLYALEIIEFEDMSSNGKNYEILSTNLQPFFWKKVKNVILQNKKAALHEFLFGLDSGRGDSYQGSNPQVEEMIQTLQNQVNYLQQKVNSLESQINHFKNALNHTLEAPRDTKISQQGNYTLKANTGSISLGSEASRQTNDNQVRKTTSQRSKSLLEDSKSPLKTSERSEEYNRSI